MFTYTATDLFSNEVSLVTAEVVIGPALGGRGGGLYSLQLAYILVSLRRGSSRGRSVMETMAVFFLKCCHFPVAPTGNQDNLPLLVLCTICTGA